MNGEKGGGNMKKSVFILIITVFSLVAFTSCGNKKGGEEMTDMSEVNTLILDTKIITYESLGISADRIDSSEHLIADAVRCKYGIAVRSYNEGATEIRVTDHWGRTATVNVRVASDGGITAETIPAETEPCSVDVRVCGAAGDGTTNDTEIIRKAIDSLKGTGGTVYFPAGRYLVDRIILGENIHLVLQGRVEDVKKGYTEELAKRIENGEFAVLLNSLRHNNLILNHNPEGSGRDGVGGIKVSGGMIDLNGATASGGQFDTGLEGPAGNPKRGDTCAVVFSNASGLTVDNVIIKDSYNGHAFQITGADDVHIQNCLFAGFTIHCNSKDDRNDITKTRETIQIEYAHSGAIPPSSYDEGEYYYCTNVEVSGCCFTKSDKSGYPLVCIGQHGMNREPNCTGLRITDNLFENPYIYAIHLLSYENVEITGNTFTSLLKATGQGPRGCFMIYANLNQPNTVYTGRNKNGGSVSVTYGNTWENRGTHNVKIENNVFRIIRGSYFRVLYAVSTGIEVGARTVENQIRPAEGKDYAEAYTGFLPSQNVICGLSFIGNDIKFSGKPAYSDCCITVQNVIGLEFADNRISGYDGFSVQSAGLNGAKITGTVNGNGAKTRTLFCGTPDVYAYIGDGSGHYISLRTDNGTRKIVLEADDGVREFFLTYKNGSVYVDAVCTEGYILSEWKGNIKPEDTVLTSDVTIKAVTVKKQ